MFCEVKTQIVGKTKFFDSLRQPQSSSCLSLFGFRRNSALVIGLVLPVVPNGLNVVVILETIEQLAHLGYENLSILKVINNMEYRQI